MKKLRTITAIAGLSLVLCSCNTKDTDPSDKKETTTEAAKQETSKDTKEKTTKSSEKTSKETTSKETETKKAGSTPSITVKESTKFKISGSNAKTVRDAEDKHDILVFDVTFKNISSKAIAIYEDMAVYAFQNGHQLEEYVDITNKIYDWTTQYEKTTETIKPGESVTVTYAFILSDDTQAQMIVFDTDGFEVCHAEAIGNGKASKASAAAVSKPELIGSGSNKDEYGNEYLYVDVKFTNNTDSLAAFSHIYSAMLYQNGIELITTTLSEDEAAVTGDTITNYQRILPGYTYTARISFKAQDDTDAFFAVAELFSDKALLTSNIKVSGKAGAAATDAPTSYTLVKTEAATIYDKKCIKIYIDFHNNEGDALGTSFSNLAYKLSATQNNNDLEERLFDFSNTDEDLFDIYSKVLKGYTQRVVLCYELLDDSDISLVIKDEKGTDLLNQTIKVK